MKKTDMALPSVPPKKFGWSGFHSKIMQRKKKAIDPYIGILPECEVSGNHSVNYSPEQFYALRRMELQMNLLNVTLNKKRGKRLTFVSLLL